MQFYTKQHKFYCGIDLHTKNMYVCILDEKGEIREHRDMKTKPESFLAAIAPYREDIVVAVECMFAWYWIADLCQKEGIAFVLGHALYMKAIHGGKAKNDKIDSKKIAVLLRGGMIPMSYVYPEKMGSHEEKKPSHEKKSRTSRPYPRTPTVSTTWMSPSAPSPGPTSAEEGISPAPLIILRFRRVLR